MIDIWILTLTSVFFVSIISLIGIVTLSLRENTLARILICMVGFAAGSLLGGAFIHLLPETVEQIGFGVEVSSPLLMGIVFFFILEKFIQWRHCHIPTSKSHPHPFAYMNLVGDGVHNFIDGVVIAASYLASIPIGFATTIAVILHEIPQEIGDFGVLIYGGFSKKKALLLNFATALTAVAGAVAALIMGGVFEDMTLYLLPFTAGGFIYIASSDLIPELQKQTACSGFSRKSFLQLVFFVLGILLMYSLILME
ncbi:MAG: ZIP family metal transporter [Candidatus Aenigmatarchaeota archaeon]|nr:MAG: ZIP family metal transporter [Candidatus Aenigmarchaeota archaeon]